MDADTELPPELDENTPVVWPTDPEEETQDTDEDTKEDKPCPSSSSDSKSSNFSYWFGGVVKTEEDELSEEGGENLEGKKTQISRPKKTEEDEDADWTEENDGEIVPKKRLKRTKQEVSNDDQSSGGDGNSGEIGEGKLPLSRFRFSWTEDFKWLEYDATSKEMFCSICQQAGMKGEFATEGSKNISKTSLHFHDTSDGHKEAEFYVNRLSSNESDSSTLLAPEPTPGVDEESEDMESQNTLYSVAALCVALRTAFYAAQNDHDKTCTEVYKSMMALQDACNVLGAKELRLGKQLNKCMVLNTHADSEEETQFAFGDDESLAEMHDVLARIVQEDLYDKIRHRDYISIIIQEYPDADLLPLQMQLVVHARYAYRGYVNAGFLGIIMASQDKPEEAVKEVLRVLEECDIPMHKVVAVQIQCPRKNGKLLTSSGIHHWKMAKHFADVSSNMMVLVSAQRHPLWNNCISSAVQNLEEGTKYQHLLGRLVTYLQGISSKLQDIEPLKELINDPLCQWDGLQMPPWMMLQKTAKVVCSTWPTLIEVLQTEANTQKDSQAQELSDELQKYQFLSFIHLLLDCIPIVNDLEVQVVNMSPKEACQRLTEALNNLQEQPGEHQMKFADGLVLEKKKKTFCNHNIYVSDQQQERADQMQEEFIQDICSEVDSRCSVMEKTTVLRRLFRILDPAVLSSKKEPKLGEFGREELPEIASLFLSSDKDLFPEYQEMKMLLVTHHKNDSLKSVSEKIHPSRIQKQVPMTPKGAERCLNMIKLLRCAVTIPGVCRRADHHVALMLKRTQDFVDAHGTEATTLSRMMIANHGGKIAAFDFNAALQEWNSL